MHTLLARVIKPGKLFANKEVIIFLKQRAKPYDCFSPPRLSRLLSSRPKEIAQQEFSSVHEPLDFYKCFEDATKFRTPPSWFVQFDKNELWLRIGINGKTNFVRSPCQSERSQRVAKPTRKTTEIGRAHV